MIAVILNNKICKPPDVNLKKTAFYAINLIINDNRILARGLYSVVSMTAHRDELLCNNNRGMDLELLSQHRSFPQVTKMKHFINLEIDRQSKVLRWLVLGIAVLVLAFSVIEVFSFSFTNIVILAVSIFVSALISKYEVKIPGTGIIFAPKIVIAFWGIIWLGVPGGTLLAACASLASLGAFRNRKSAWLSVISTDVFCTFNSAAIYYNTLGYLTSLQPAIGGENPLVPYEVIIAGFFMALTHYVMHSMLSFISCLLENGPPNSHKLRGIFLMPAASHAVSLFPTILSFLTFNHFGIEFGLVIVPIAVIGNLAYKIHSRRLEQHTKQISEASRIHLATVEALATAIDARDQVGVGHVCRTQLYSVGIGTVMGLPEDDVNALRTGALLHDIGKLAVPDHILNKPGRLTPAEMEKAKIHSSVSASILEKVGFEYPVVPTVKYHHECWDGSGYPEGLKGSNIPLTARILSVADAYDTLRGARPYRGSVSREDACNFLRAGAGTQFDPNIVSTFLRNLRSFDAEVDSQGLSYKYEADKLNAPAQSAVPNYVEQIKRANREVFTLYEMARDFSSSLNLDETLSLFTKKVAEFVPFDTCLVYLIDETNEFATAVYADGKHATELKGKRVKVGDGATGYVLKKCKSIENVDPALDFAIADIEMGKNYVAMASLPLLADEKLIGAVSLYSSELAIYEEEHLRLLETISRIAADAICKSVQHATTEIYALTDPMTGLPNARSLQMHFDKETARAKRSGNNFQLLVLDLDGFKAVNDTFGHKTGDKMLKEISKVIRGELRDYDFLARYGGDEFVAIVPDAESSSVIELCRRIEAAVNAFSLPVGEDNFARVGVSLGSAGYPNHGETFDQMIIAADKAMYLTKAFHKQRNARLEEQLSPKSESESTDSDSGTTVHEIAECDIILPATFENEVIVELDESHIIAYATVN